MSEVLLNLHQYSCNRLTCQGGYDVFSVHITASFDELHELLLNKTFSESFQWIQLICKMACVLGQDNAHHLILNKFLLLCSDTLCNIRKICADNFGELCNVMGMNITEETLLPVFLNLCKDDDWHVRQACATVVMPVACMCTSISRRNKVAPVFVTLLTDTSHLVRRAAFHVLGPLISTFADPERIEQFYGVNSCIMFSNLSFQAIHKEIYIKNDFPLSESMKKNAAINDDPFNYFQYWRLPVVKLSNSDYLKLTSLSTSKLDIKTDAFLENDMNQINEDNASVHIESDLDAVFCCMENLKMDGNCQELPVVSKQQRVPESLIYHFLSMANSDRDFVDDVEICAYSLPAVALTLGPANWNILRDVYEQLALDTQWRVRRSLAFSIYHMALILGDDITVSDLVPIFNGFIKDVDEVREGALRYLTSFISLVHIGARPLLLVNFHEFLKTDNERNWRYRKEFAEQLSSVCGLFSSIQVINILTPLVYRLLEDQVAEVRNRAVYALCCMLSHIYQCGDILQFHSELNQIVAMLSKHRRWQLRQVFILICDMLIKEQKILGIQWIHIILVPLMKLAEDPVVNVRISLASSLRRVFSLSSLMYQYSPYRKQILNCLHLLATDTDEDVRQQTYDDTTDDLSAV